MMIDLAYYNSENIDDVKWLMLNYGNMITTDLLRKIYEYAYNYGMIEALYEYIVQR